jgi:hypothetical protein
MVTIFPSILPDGDNFVDNTYTSAELARMEWEELRTVAADHPTDECNGSDTAEDIRATLEGKRRV